MMHPARRTPTLSRRRVLEFAAGGVGALLFPGRVTAGSAEATPRTLTAEQSAKIDALATAQAGTTTPGFQLGIGYGGTVLAARGYGQRSLAPVAPLLATTPMFVGSITKQLTAACVLLLHEEGALSIDDALDTHVPEIAYGSSISLRQMLWQVSGLDPDPYALFDAPAPFVPTSTANYLARLARRPVRFASGAKFQYSNPNYWLLGLIVERVAKTDYNSFLQTRVFAKAGMPSSYLMGARSNPDTALGYESAAGGSFVAAKPWDVSYLFSTGGVVSTVADVLAWDHALLAGLLLKPASLEAMFSQPPMAAGLETHYGMGWVIGRNVVWHNGELNGFHAMNGTFSDGYAVVVLGNESGPEGKPDRWVPEDLAVAVHAVLNPSLDVKRDPRAEAPPGSA